jgi:hypothetical protein
VGTLFGSETHVGRSKAPAFCRELLGAGPFRIEDDRELQTDDPDPNPAMRFSLTKVAGAMEIWLTPGMRCPGAARM